ncbi:flagellar type III secretion system pore protein FliP [Cellulomonas hominis]|uniref:flagellar type III secretion system pore protein FliP n=1 Tax=Cellulomonas hominis TaxID=156981 RepID=UPI001B9DE2AD|nr:Flagellar biosynthetic protein FliP [Cellulomonas hominis]
MTADARAAARPSAAAAPRRTWPLVLLAVLALAVALVVLGSGAAHAAPVPPTDPVAPVAPVEPGTGEVSVSINGVNGTPSSSIVVLIGITLLSVAPSLLLMMTGFTKIFVVLSLTRNALGLTTVPPNQVIAGLALFLSLFVMAPVLSDVNTQAVQPYLDGSMDFQTALDAGSAPMREYMLGHTREQDLALVTRAADQPNPQDAASVPMLTLIPAFMLSELRSAFIIGFVIFIPFLVIDLVVSSVLMSMGMMMLPPVMVSLPFKLLLFVLVDGWGLIVTALIGAASAGGG